MHQRGKADGGDLPRNLSDSNRSAKLVGSFTADNDAADIAQRPIDHEPGFLTAKPNRQNRRNRFVFNVAGRHRAADAENADAMDVAKIVLDLLERRRRLQHELRAIAVNTDRKRAPGAVADDAL